jgi:hypothetical protein
MDIIINAGSFTPHQIKLFNACRLYLGVTLLSDITSSSGTFIHRTYQQGIRPTTHNPKTIFPYQNNPNAASWRIWRRGLALLTHPASLLLQHPLSHWLITGDKTYRRWRSYIDPSTKEVFLRGTT